MDYLKINGKDCEIKFNHRFYDRVVTDYAKKHKDSDVDGFNNLIGGLISKDPDAVVRAYRCAIVGKDHPTANDVADALDEAGVFDDKNIYSKVFKEIKSSGFLAGKINHLLVSLKNVWRDSEIALEEALKQSDKNDKDYSDMIRGAKTEVALNKRGYELAKKKIQELSK